MNSGQAQLIRSQLGRISDVMASPATGSDAVLWATARVLEAADLLLQAYLAGQSPAADGIAREALLEAVTNCRAATVAATAAIRAPGAARPGPDPHPRPAVAQAGLD